MYPCTPGTFYYEVLISERGGEEGGLDEVSSPGKDRQTISVTKVFIKFLVISLRCVQIVVRSKTT